MGELLLNYFQSLKQDDILDKDILDAVLGCLKMSDKGDFTYKKNQSSDRPWHQRGFFLPKYQSWYIPYIEGAINCHSVTYGQDALSADFSGCAMAYYSNKEGTYFVSHICLTGKNDLYDCREMWCNYCNYMKWNRVSIFRPKTISLELYLESPSWRKWGLISSRQEMYDITVCYVFQGHKISAIQFKKIVKHTPSFTGSNSRFLPIAEDEDTRNRICRI